MELIQSCWRKWIKDDLKEADKKLIDAQYNALKIEDWNTAKRIGEFAKEIEIFDGSHRNILDINYCQCLKWQGEKEALKNELQKFDESDLSPLYKLALSALKSDKDGFYENLKKAAIIKELKREDLYEWPLFRELREDHEYKVRVDEAFGQVNS